MKINRAMEFKKHWLHFALQFLILFLPLCVLVSGILAYIYSTEAKNGRTILEMNEANNAYLLRKVMAADFQAVAQDLMFLSEHHELKGLLDRGEWDTKDLAKDYHVFSKRKKIFDQVRYLDAAGMEVVRINFNNGSPSIVPKSQLQNKAKRYYFKDVFVLKEGEIFVSPLDLNIEHGEIEQPLKPMIRFGTPVFDSRGRKGGIVLLNYFGAKLIENVQRASYSSGQILLLNSDGYYLKGIHPRDEWGFMYTDRKDRVFKNDFSEAWRTINDAESGQFHTKDGLFTFTTIYPLSEAQKSSTGSGKAFEPSARSLSTLEYYWKIVSRVEPSLVNAASQRVLIKLVQFYGVLLVLLSVSSWHLTRLRMQKKKAQENSKAFADKLELSNRELEDFAYVASHDLQEPLRKVTAFGEQLKTKYGNELGEKGGDYLERMQSAARRMQGLINNLLTYSLVTTKAQPFVPVDLGRVAQEVLSDLEVKIEQTNGRVDVGDLPTIDADPLQMRQLFQNLIGNALKFHRADEPPVVTIRSALITGNGTGGKKAAAGTLCRITVEDNGVGFEEKNADSIFGAFQRLHGRSEYEGTGIGLAICRKIVERHGGSIMARSTAGQGATFTITLPCKR